MADSSVLLKTMACKVIVKSYLRLMSNNMARLNCNSSYHDTQGNKDFVLYYEDHELHKSWIPAFLWEFITLVNYLEDSSEHSLPEYFPCTETTLGFLCFKSREKLSVLETMKKIMLLTWVAGSKDLNTFETTAFTTWTQLYLFVSLLDLFWFM